MTLSAKADAADACAMAGICAWNAFLPPAQLSLSGNTFAVIDYLSAQGTQKRVFAVLSGDGPEAVEKEVYSKVPWLMEQGGYIPAVDDIIMPDISFKSFMHYAELIRSFRF